MKLNITPKNIFRSRKNRSVSRSDPSSFSSGTTSSDSPESTHHKSQAGTKIHGFGTPKSVLRPLSDEILSDEWSEIPTDMNFELVQGFKLIDGDGDGKITRAELEALLSRVGAEPLSEEDLSMMLSDVDRDGDGCISLKKFNAISSAFEPPACDDEMRGVFDVFDMNHDGKITAEELLGVFTSIGVSPCTLEDCRRMISGVDGNGDGVVCFEDFSRMMEHQPR